MVKQGCKSNPETYGDVLFESGAHPHPVAQKAPNVWGLYDTLGNVWEWTGSSFTGAGSKLGGNDPGRDVGTQVLRGGAWSFGARLCRVSARGSAPDRTGALVSVSVALWKSPETHYGWILCDGDVFATQHSLLSSWWFTSTGLNRSCEWPRGTAESEAPTRQVGP